MTGWSETVSPITQVPARRVLAMEPVAVRQAFLIRAFAIVGAVAMLVSAGTAFGRAAPESFADLAAKLLPSVVNISTSQTIKRSGTRGNPEGTPQQRPQLPPGSPFEEFFKEFFDRQGRGESAPRRAQSLGSGFIIDKAGIIVTNNHVIDGADEIYVILHDNTKLKAKLIGRDAKTDLAVLKVNAKSNLTAVTFGNSKKSRVGDWVVAIGNPFGLGGTVTAGIVSARARNINSGPYDDFIQTDASINKGNSGGPLFNLEGQVVGINTAIYSQSGGSVGIGFSIPSNQAKPIIDQIKEFGRARRGWLGVNIQTVTDELAESLGLGKARGALVANLTEGGPAKDSDIKVGDVILKFNGADIEKMRALPRIVAETPVGKSVEVVVWRQGKEKSVKLALGEFPEDVKVAVATARKDAEKQSARTTIDELGFKLASLDDELRARFKIDESVKGVVVTAVSKESPAAEKGVRPGDIVRKVGASQEAVNAPSQVSGKVEMAIEGKLKSLLFLFERDGNARFVALRIGKSEG
jgi:serine protease Do